MKMMTTTNTVLAATLVAQTTPGLASDDRDGLLRRVAPLFAPMAVMC